MLLGAIDANAQGNCYRDSFIFTPAGTQVQVGILCDDDLTPSEQKQKLDNLILLYGNQITFVQGGEATLKYDCHSYAWIEKSNPKYKKVRLGVPTAFVTDGSYEKLSGPTGATHVLYGTDTHSALIVDANSSPIKVESKWGADGPVVRHPINVGWSGALSYYVRPIDSPPTINGPSLICWGASNISFTASYWVSGFTWDRCSSIISIGGSGQTVTVSSTSGGSMGAPCWIILKYKGTEITRKQIWVGPPTISNIYGPSYAPVNEYIGYSASYNSLSAPSSFNWSSSGGYLFYGNSEASVYFYSTGYYQVSSRASNTCGTGAYNYLDFTTTGHRPWRGV